MSDNESELSRGSGRSGRSHRKHRRHRSRNRESGSERGSNRDYNHNEKCSEPAELIEVSFFSVFFTNNASIYDVFVICFIQIVEQTMAGSAKKASGKVEYGKCTTGIGDKKQYGTKVKFN
jgi:hypothetical protein